MSTVPAPFDPPDDGRLARGTPVDRYIVLDVLGAGGMGVVYSAYDPELDRKVAIKLLQASASGEPRPTEPLGGAAGSSPEQSRLLREAQALARLSHPNVVAVHDVGTLSGHRVFIAMELVAGGTLRAWLEAEPRTWREVVPMLRAAGAGLVAAHAAGLVHRDFKPENVIVGPDGRVRVMDFGLARLRREHRDGDAAASDNDLKVPTAATLSEELTRAGAIVGTPAYMAPEIYAGKDADARADQFAFGVVLYESLFRVRPFLQKDLSGSSVALPKPPDDTDVPARLARVAMRAIAIDPAERYPSMTSLLEDLVDEPVAHRRRAVIVAVLGLAAAASAAGVLATRHSSTELCTGAGGRLAGVWDPKVAAAAQAAFLASKKPFAAQSFAGVQRALDAYSAQWTEASVESCRATRVRGEQSEEVMTLRGECLDQRLEELRAFTQLVATAQGTLVDQGDKAVFALEPVAKCANVAALREPGAPPADKRAEVLAVQKQLADAKAQLIASRYLVALDSAAKTLAGAKAIGWQPLAAEALFVRGGTLLATGNVPDAVAALSESTWTALRGRRDDLAAVSAFAAAMATSDGLSNPDTAKVWLGLGITAAARSGVDHAVELRRYEIEGLVLAEAGDLEGGIAAHEKALEVAELAFGKDSPALWADEEIVATTYTKADAFAKAIPHYERSLRAREASVGPDHPEIAILLSNLGQCYRHVHDLKRAREMLERALAMREKMFGSTNPVLLAPLDNLGDLTVSEGDVAGAIALYERALKIAAVMPGTANANYHQVATDRALALVTAGRLADARSAFADVLALEESSHSPLLPATQSARAELALAEHAWGDAATWAERAIAGFEAKGGTNAPLLWLPLTRLAEAKLAQGDADAARAPLERALAIGKRFEITPQDLDRTRGDYAKLGLPPPR
jgi:tetratricopeptide (TPR) repeat protein